MRAGTPHYFFRVMPLLFVLALFVSLPVGEVQAADPAPITREGLVIKVTEAKEKKDLKEFWPFAAEAKNISQGPRTLHGEILLYAKKPGRRSKVSPGGSCVVFLEVMPGKTSVSLIQCKSSSPYTYWTFNVKKVYKFILPPD